MVSMPGRCNLMIMGSFNTEKTLMRNLIFGNRRFDELGVSRAADEQQMQYRYLHGTKVLMQDFIQRKDYRPYHFSEYGNFFYNCHYFLFVLNAYETPEVIEEDFAHYIKCLNKLQEKAPNARVFVMLHKKKESNNVAELPVKTPWKTDEEYKLLEERFHEVTKPIGKFEKELTIYRTNIDNATYFTAWSAMVRTIRPSFSAGWEKKLAELVVEWGAEEIVIFEGHTLFTVAQAGTGKYTQPQRLEKIAISLKRFSEPYTQPSRPVHSLQSRFANFQLVVQPFYLSTYMMVVTQNMETTVEEMSAKIRALRLKYEDVYNTESRWYDARFAQE